ncbi:MAG: single-stranded DNA-binding protein [Patescibacteria group bacterium]|nr:single-stranded DNA-binding protein [Patescibacteria group bacterium]MDD5121253.1 single-stranded DNA-binding protein [Patescibacteria group bacterium]MDD5395828.1 single-stranded DNA-binding protein [Patescibacteria group bacterium]
MDLNKALIIGRLTKAPEIRTTPSGQNVASFGMATNRFWTDRNGQKQKSAEFHNIVVWGRLAEIAQKFLTKGSLAYIEGRIQTRNWQDPQGVKHYRTEIVAERLQIGPKASGASANQAESEESFEPVEATPNQGSSLEEEISPDEIPF